MSHRLQDMKITTRLISSNYIHYLFTNDRFFKTRDLLKKENAFPNTDIRPVCYQYAFIIWLSKFFPRLALLDLSSIMDKKFFKQSLLLLCIILPVIFLSSRSRPAPRRALLAATAGLIGMVLETILILYYQAKHGGALSGYRTAFDEFHGWSCFRRFDSKQSNVATSKKSKNFTIIWSLSFDWILHLMHLH